MAHLKNIVSKITRLTLGRSFKSMWNFWSGGLWENIFACGAVTKFGIFKFRAVGVKADRLKPVRNDFQSVYLFIERREGTFYKLEPWNKRKYVWPSRLRGIDAFDSILSASFVAILLSPNFARRRASNLCVLYNTVYTEWYSGGQTRWNGLKIGECVLNNVINKFVHQYCDLNCI